jgi:hypothetical protein
VETTEAPAKLAAVAVAVESKEAVPHNAPTETKSVPAVAMTLNSIAPAAVMQSPEVRYESLNMPKQKKKKQTKNMFFCTH